MSVQEVWRRSGLPGAPREGNILVKSPFREDRKKSFSIFARGQRWRDHALGKAERGGVWDFAAKATGKSGKELADWLIEQSGIVRTPVRRVAASAEGGDEADEEERGPSRRAKKKTWCSAEARAAWEREWQHAHGPLVGLRVVREWAAGVAVRWAHGAARAEEMALLARERAWPEAWVAQLVAMGKVAWPLLPWVDTERGRERERAVAWLVEKPIEGGLAPVGYHQRFIGREGEKTWVYVPYFVAEDRARSEFQRALRAEALAAGAPEGESLVPGLPCVLGPVAGPVRVLVITEGQWDAATLAGACGWLEAGAWPAGVVVMGVRGANGADTLLAYWGAWIARWKPAVLVLADNDRAGRWWDARHQAGEDEPWIGDWVPGVVPSFADKLRAAGAERVVVRRVAKELGKDFNDYWRARRPARERLAAWLQRLGFDIGANNA